MKVSNSEQVFREEFMHLTLRLECITENNNIALIARVLVDQALFLTASIEGAAPDELDIEDYINATDKVTKLLNDIELMVQKGLH
tara:strand:- start:110 stop:364 length:255 start_codon:yes stop_codon:yes gene_type:complete